MVAAVTLHGPWHVALTSLETAFEQRVTLTGSDHDGTYPATVGSVHASGETWTISCEWQNPAALGWFPSDIKVTKSHTPRDGLVYVLAVDDNTTDPGRDLDYNDIVLTCVCEDPDIVPKVTKPPIHFVLPPENIIDGDPGRPDGPHPPD